MKLGHPSSVQASSSAYNSECAPVASEIHYEFPARPKEGKFNLPAVSVTWYDGGLLPPRPQSLPDGENLGENGVLFHGTKGLLFCGIYGSSPRFLPDGKFANLKKPAPIRRRVATSHEMDFVRACKESPENRVLPHSNFEYAGPLNEMVVMGNLAVRLKSLNKILQWDGVNMRITNLSPSDEIKVANGIPKQEPRTLTLNAIQAAEGYIRHNYRSGWSLE